VRNLLHIPIIHDEVDLGSAGSALGRRGADMAGKRRWALHRETVCRFWESVGDYLSQFDSSKMRVYQDGVPVDGTMGRRIVEEGARRGSRNYQLVLELLDNYAQLQAAEHPTLLLQEYANLRAEGRQAPSPEQRAHLLEERDSYIAQVINSTLQEGDVGVLFIGAGHNVGRDLASDICVREVKDAGKVHLYIQELLLGNGFAKIEALARYVAAPVDVS